MTNSIATTKDYFPTKPIPRSRRNNRTLVFQKIIFSSLSLAFLSGCSVRRFAINKAADALASSGTSFASDDDPELIKAAAPFSLKLMESLLAENPRHTGLLLAAASGFTQYSYAFVQQDADEIEERDLAASETGRNRARKLYFRAKNYGLRGLETKHPGFKTNLLARPKEAVRAVTKDEVPLLYWTAAAWGSAIALSKNNPDLVGEIPAMESLIDRALELDAGYSEGAIHNFLISYEMSRQGVAGDAAARSRKHFERAIQLSEGKSAAPFVSLAEAVTIKKQDAKEFESLLNSALAINPDVNPDTRLLNTIMQRRARWLLSHKSDLFLE